MNAHSNIPLVRDHTYVINPDDLTEDGRDYCGRMFPPQKLGKWICKSCDSVIGPDGWDALCECLHIDLAAMTTETVSDPFYNRKVA